MKFRISMFFALTAICCASSAQGQYYPQQQAAPIASPQQNWNPAAVGPIGQQTIGQNAGYNNPVAGAPATGAAGCGGGCDGGGCDGGGCGIGGRGCDGGGCGGFGGGYGGGRFGGGGGFGGGGFGSGSYDPCNPTRYFSAFGGITHFDDIVFGVNAGGPQGPPTNIEALLGTDEGIGLGGAIGRSIGQRFRGELEFTYRNADVEYGALNVNGNQAGAIALGGDVTTYSFIPNLLFDLNPNGRFNMYFGVGAGVSFNEVEAIEPTTPIALNLNGSSFAYQGIIGLSTCINQRTDLFFEYRYFATDEFNIDIATPIGSASAATQIESHNYFVGIRVKRW